LTDEIAIFYRSLGLASSSIVILHYFWGVWILQPACISGHRELRSSIET
jgi:hypothetical protein